MIKCTRSSNLVHRRLALRFKESYEHRRINITMLFGHGGTPAGGRNGRTGMVETRRGCQNVTQRRRAKGRAGRRQWPRADKR